MTSVGPDARANGADACPTETAILAFVAGEAGGAGVGAHLESCDECRRLVSLLAGPAESVAAIRERPPSAPPRAAPALRPGDVIAGKYEIVGEIGRGGMGVVVKALHRTLGQHVALKLLVGALAGDTLAIARFLREARAVAALGSEHVVRVLDADRLPSGEPFLVLEYLEGRDLGAELRARGPLPIAEAVDCALGACEALVLAHRKQIVHRDIKPSNLFRTIGVDGSVIVKVLDFGVAKVWKDAARSVDLTDRASIVGSPRYMPPEQLRSSDSVDARADVWALAVSLFELLTGRAPFEGATLIEICAAIAAEPPAPLGALRPDAPAGLSAALDRALVKDREQRTPSIDAFAEAIAPYASGDSAALVARIRRIAGPVATLQPGAALAPASSPTLALGEAPTLAVVPVVSSSRPGSNPLAIGGAALVAVAVLAWALGRGGLSAHPASSAIAPEASSLQGDPRASRAEVPLTPPAPAPESPSLPIASAAQAAPAAPAPSSLRSPRSGAPGATTSSASIHAVLPLKVAAPGPARGVDAGAPNDASPLHRDGLLDRK